MRRADRTAARTRSTIAGRPLDRATVADVRASVCAGLRHLGVGIDPDANAATTADGDISAADAKARTVVVTAAEDLEIARETRRLLAT